MRILLVQPALNWEHRWCESPSVALLILGTLAKQRGHEVEIVHLDIDLPNPDRQWATFADILKECKPEVVGITCNTFQVNSARNVAREAKQYGAFVILGGPHACAWDGEAALVVQGQGENAWLEAIGEKACVNTIDDVPHLNYRLVDLDRFTGVSCVGASPSIAIMASRGCPFNCIFCNTPVFWGKKVQYRAPAWVLEEVAYLHRKYAVQEIFFQDDTFNLNHEWAMAIFDGICSRGLNKEMVFRITSRANEKLLTAEFLKAAAKAGVWNIFYGVESGSPEMLQTMKKGITVEEIRRAARMTHEAGIQLECSFVVGLPGETWATLRQTDALIREIKPSRYGWCHACPFPATELDRLVTAAGHKPALDYAQYTYGRQYVRTAGMTLEELGKFGGFTYMGG